MPRVFIIICPVRSFDYLLIDHAIDLCFCFFKLGMGLGDMWDAVQTEDGRTVYRNSLVTGTGVYTSSNGRLGYRDSEKYQDR